MIDEIRDLLDDYANWLRDETTDPRVERLG